MHYCSQVYFVCFIVCDVLHCVVLGGVFCCGMDVLCYYQGVWCSYMVSMFTVSNVIQCVMLGLFMSSLVR